MQELSTTYIYKDIPINTDEIISHVVLKNRRLIWGSGHPRLMAKVR